MSMTISNCRLVSPGVDLSGRDIVVENGIIQAIEPTGKTAPTGELFDAEGRMALPGFVDVHFHGAAGRDVTDGDVEAIAAIAAAKLAEGVTTMVPATLTLPTEALTKALRSVADYAEGAPKIKIPGVHLEGPFINSSCCGAQNPDYVRPVDIAEVDVLKNVFNVSIVTFAVEGEGGVQFTRDLVERGIVPACGHSAATHAQFLEARKVGLKHLTHFCNQMSKLHHREIGLVGAGLLDDDLMLEVIADGVHLCPDMLRLIFKKKSIETIMLITDSIAASGLADGVYSLGGLEVNVKDGAARLASNDALAGSTLSMCRALRNGHEITGLPLKDLVRVTALNQAESLGLENIGKIEPGRAADLVVLDDDFNPRAVFVDGKKAFTAE